MFYFPSLSQGHQKYGWKGGFKSGNHKQLCRFRSIFQILFFIMSLKYMAYDVPWKQSSNYMTNELILNQWSTTLIRIESKPIYYMWPNCPIVMQNSLFFSLPPKSKENTTKLKNLRWIVPQNKVGSEDGPSPACFDGVFWHVNKPSWRARSAGLTPFQILQNV